MALENCQFLPGLNVPKVDIVVGPPSLDDIVSVRGKSEFGPYSSLVWREVRLRFLFFSLTGFVAVVLAHLTRGQFVKLQWAGLHLQRQATAVWRKCRALHGYGVGQRKRPDAQACHGVPQGQLPLNLDTGKDFRQEVIAPSAGAAFHRDAVLARMLLEQREGEAVEPGKVFT